MERRTTLLELSILNFDSKSKLWDIIWTIAATAKNIYPKPNKKCLWIGAITSKLMI